MNLGRRASRARVSLFALGVSGALLSGCASGPGATTAALAPSREAPDEPTNLSVSFDGNVLRASWSAPVDEGDSPVKSYRVFTGKRASVTVPASVTQYEIGGIGPTEVPLVQVAAVSQVGQGKTAMGQAERPLAAINRSQLQQRSAPATSAVATKPASKAQTPPAPTPTVTVTAPSTPQKQSTGVNDDFVALYKKVSPSVVEVWNTACYGPSSSGTAFFVAPNLLLTNEHVVAGWRELTVDVNGQTIPAEVLGMSFVDDLALLRIGPTYNGRELPLASDLPPVGTRHAAIGFPLGLGKSMQVGTVSAVNVTLKDPSRGTRTGLIQSDAQMNRGNSGGPLLTSDGQVIGVAAAMAGTRDPDMYNVAIAVGAPVAATWVKTWKEAAATLPASC